MHDCFVLPLDEVLRELGNTVEVTIDGDLRFPNGGVLRNELFNHINLYGEGRDATYVGAGHNTGEITIIADDVEIDIPSEMLE
jgi:hypothetical protein